MVNEQMCLMNTDDDECYTHLCFSDLQCWLASCPYCLGKLVSEGCQSNGAVACTNDEIAALPAARTSSNFGVPLTLF